MVDIFVGVVVSEELVICMALHCVVLSESGKRLSMSDYNNSVQRYSVLQ